MKRRKRKPHLAKKKALHVTNAQDDNRPKGPKIQGFSSSSKIESTKSQNLQSIAPLKTIRTAVLPFPKAKYKPVMHD